MLIIDENDKSAAATGGPMNPAVYNAVITTSAPSGSNTPAFPTPALNGPAEQPPPYEVTEIARAREPPLPHSVSAPVPTRATTNDLFASHSQHVGDEGFKPGDFPPSFSRHPPPTIPRSQFAPIYVVGYGSHISKGFPSCAPPFNAGTSGSPHPFVIHDVNEQDWTRFIQDLYTASQLTKGERSFAGNVPIIGFLPFIGTAVEAAVKQIILLGKGKPTSQMVDTWNHHFFRPRNLEVILMKGPTRISGPPGAPIPHLGITTPNFQEAANAGPSSLTRMRSMPMMGMPAPGLNVPQSSAHHGRTHSQTSLNSISSVSTLSSSEHQHHAPSPPHPSDSKRPQASTSKSCAAGPSRCGPAGMMDRHTMKRELRSQRREWKRERRMQKREMKMERWSRKAEIKKEKRNDHGIYDNLYRLVVVPL